MSKNKQSSDPFDKDNEVQSNWVKFTVPQEDKIFGTLISKRQMKSTLPGKEGELVWVYELKADYGSFHDLDEKKRVIEEPIEVEENSLWNIGGRAIIDRQMQNIKIGQKIGLKFIEEVEPKTKGFNPAKVIKVYAPKSDDGAVLMDEEWLAEQEEQDDLMKD